MIKFDNYYSLKEDPDYVEINNDDLRVSVEYDFDDNSVFGFGFLNTDIVYKGVKPFEEMKNMQGELAMGRGLSHGLIKKQFFLNLKQGIVTTHDSEHRLIKFDLSDPIQHKKFMDTSLMRQVNARIMFSPSGRIWTKAINELDRKPVVLISFWAFKDKEKNKDNDPSSFGSGDMFCPNGYEITSIHIKRILNKAGVPRDQWNDAYIEFLEDVYEGSRAKRLTLREFLGQRPVQEPVEKTKEQEEKDQELVKQAKEKIKIGAHGNALNPNFGSPVQTKKAQQAGVPSYAEYKAKRNPYGESVDSHKK
jgi:hypothetical protein